MQFIIPGRFKRPAGRTWRIFSPVVRSPSHTDNPVWGRGLKISDQVPVCLYSPVHDRSHRRWMILYWIRMGPFLNLYFLRNEAVAALQALYTFYWPHMSTLRAMFQQPWLPYVLPAIIFWDTMPHATYLIGFFLQIVNRFHDKNWVVLILQMKHYRFMMLYHGCSLLPYLKGLILLPFKKINVPFITIITNAYPMKQNHFSCDSG